MSDCICIGWHHLCELTLPGVIDPLSHSPLQKLLLAQYLQRKCSSCPRIIIYTLRRWHFQPDLAHAHDDASMCSVFPGLTWPCMLRCRDSAIHTGHRDVDACGLLCGDHKLRPAACGGRAALCSVQQGQGKFCRCLIAA